MKRVIWRIIDACFTPIAICLWHGTKPDRHGPLG